MLYGEVAINVIILLVKFKEVLRPLREKAHLKIREGAVRSVERLWQIEIEGKENLERAREHLREGSLILIFNHSFSGDVFCGGAVCSRAFGKELRRLAVPAAKKHLDLNRAFRNFLWQEEIERSEAGKLIRDVLVIRLITNLLKMEVMPIVQSHDQEYYGEKTATRSWRNMFRQGRQIFSQQGVMLLYSPEGHRSEDGNLQRARVGLIPLLVMGGESCLCLPLGIVVEGKKGTGLHFWSQVEIEVGELFGLDDLLASLSERSGKGRRLSKREKEILADRVMVDHIVPLIPQDRLGYYQDFDFSSTALPLDR